MHHQLDSPAIAATRKTQQQLLLNGAEIFTLRVISLVSHPGFFLRHSETSLLLFGKVDLENVK